MTKFIGREKELESLKGLLRKKTPDLFVRRLCAKI
jgi:AAA+ ATPase superfamily predicted ATPase